MLNILLHTFMGMTVAYRAGQDSGINTFQSTSKQFGEYLEALFITKGLM